MVLYGIVAPDVKLAAVLRLEYDYVLVAWVTASGFGLGQRPTRAGIPIKKLYLASRMMSRPLGTKRVLSLMRSHDECLSV